MKESEAKKTIILLDQELEQFDRAYEEGRWLKNQGLLTNSHQADLEGRRASILLREELQDIISEFLPETTDPDFHRLLFVLDRLIKYAKVESNPSVYEIRSRIEQAIVNYPISMGGKKATRTDIRQVLRSESNPKLRLEAMHCFDELSRQVEKDTRALVMQRNAIAREMGFNHFGELGLLIQGLSREKLSDWFVSINRATDEIYQFFLDKSAEKLRQSSLYPQDLYYAVTQFYRLPDKYFLGKKLSESINWLGDKINISNAIARVRIDYVDIPFSGICVTIHVPDDIRILMNPADGHTYYVTYFHEMGHAMHSSYIAQPHHLFRDEPGPFCEGMAQTLARFVDDPVFLSGFAHIPVELIDQYKLIWRIYNIYHMRVLIAEAEFEWQMYANPNTDLSHLLQTTQNENLKVPSIDTTAWADNVYWASYPFYIQNYLVAEMIASQTHSTLVNKFSNAIHTDCGEWLQQNYWNLGGAVEWSEKIRNYTGTELSTNQLVQELINGYPA